MTQTHKNRLSDHFKCCIVAARMQDGFLKKRSRVDEAEDLKFTHSKGFDIYSLAPLKA